MDFGNMRAVVSIENFQKEPNDWDFDELVHLAFDISLNAYLGMAEKKISKVYADGVRDGLDALLARLVKDFLGLSDEEAFRVVHGATKECYEKHKDMFDKKGEKP